jgi:8-oxo-dGTP pyrophosphatase MutT (NUDIX family)
MCSSNIADERKILPKDIVCSNCGMAGHMYRCCTHPVSSYGIICFRMVETEDGTHPEYLMVQRKDSLGFVEFARGKYDVYDDRYIGAMLSNMTPQERRLVLSATSIDALWDHLWRDPSAAHRAHRPRPAFVRDLDEARRKFAVVQSRLGTFAHLLDSDPDTETEWGFPKGRRTLQETDAECARREFVEETGIDSRHIDMSDDIPRVEELFQGSNGVYYRHLYFVARAAASMPGGDSYPHTTSEIRAVAWFSFGDCLRRIRDVYAQRKALLHRVHAGIMQHPDPTNDAPPIKRSAGHAVVFV